MNSKSWSILVWLWLMMISLAVRHAVKCQEDGDYDYSNPVVRPFITQLVYKKLSNVTNILSKDIGNQSRFCVKDSQVDWDRTFNFSSNLDFLTMCIQTTEGDMMRRLCTVAEMKLYFSSFFELSERATYSKLNKNCNLSSWVSGCEPGWACSVGDDDPVDLENSKKIPLRTENCHACCEGFFCPHGLTCMIPCPLGSYCPLAKLNKKTGLCDPYHYQLPPGQRNHTCGGANIWADVSTSSETFCSAGSYCPSTIKKKPCNNGHYCWMGSTFEKRCFKLNSCNANAKSQNIHAYGVMLIAALSTLLLIVYNCSDQVLTTRERRLAKSREAAARTARETANARQKWKSAKDAAKKHATGLQVQLSRTFSRKKNFTQPEQAKKWSRANWEAEDYDSSSSVLLRGKKKQRHQPSHLLKMLHDIETDPEGFHGFDAPIAAPAGSAPMPKGKGMETHSQIFRKAYSQLEKEKAMHKQNKNLTFSGVVSMANEIEIKKRPLVEISFKDLTLSLKSKSKHLLINVTGTFRPGRITAIMGPSGAGKTSLISAILGKAIGCKVSGLILVNGKTEAIQSYKKIIGFVQQDDIVHGNLTVEENLWFSANCRLSTELTKADKVLIVERVIESLGLQAVRDSLVGTVEKRGISGGQRKRVNVGLEMVIEPSLLILDEPTSGLDSASSQLLLRALKREALEGVNICMVVHQPSYTLFKMFDDLVLLAKGGRVAYHGSAKKVEEYFSGLGINVPECVTPPDHYIDILEGMAVPSAGSRVNFMDLPLCWMLHNGYPIPMEMQQVAIGLVASAPEISVPLGLSAAASKDQSFAGEFWQDVKSNVEWQQDNLRYNLFKSRDLSNRKTPGLLQQYKYFLGRICKQRLREAQMQAIDYLILLLAGACLGSLAKGSDETFGAAGYTYTIIAVSLLCKIAALRSFSLEKLQFWRESAAGMSSLAYFLAKDTMDLFNVMVKPMVYLSMFYFFTNPRSSFADNYVVLLCLVYCVTGIAYAIAIFFQPGPAQLWSVLLPVVLTLIATRPKDGHVVKYMSNLCYPKWALEAFVIANAERYYGVWLITRCGSLMQSEYSVHDWALCISSLTLFGMISRLVALVGLVTFQKR